MIGYLRAAEGRTIRLQPGLSASVLLTFVILFD